MQRAVELHPSDLADVLVTLDEPVRIRALAELPLETASKALAELEGRVRHPEDDQLYQVYAVDAERRPGGSCR